MKLLILVILIKAHIPPTLIYGMQVQVNPVSLQTQTQKTGERALRIPKREKKKNLIAAITKAVCLYITCKEPKVFLIDTQTFNTSNLHKHLRISIPIQRVKERSKEQFQSNKRNGIVTNR